MSEYKRRKVKKSPIKFKKIRKKNKKEIEDQEVLDEETKEPVETVKEEKTKKKDSIFSGFRVIESKKPKIKSGKGIKAVLALLIIACLVALLSFVLPTGISEAATNAFAVLGNGGYPVTYNGSLTIDSVQNGLYYYVLNDTSLSAFTVKGKEIFTHIHGLTNPVLVVSSQRAIVFDQNGKQFNVYNLSGLIDTVTTKENIINATICRNGTYAISTSGGEYTSSVTVYNKRNTKLYTWNSAKDIINNVSLSPNGKRLVVSLLNVSGGQASSKISVLEYSSANPMFSYDFGTQIVLSVKGNGNGFSCITDSSYDFFKWGKYEHTTHSVSDKQLAFYRTNGSDTVLVFNRESDKSDNHIVFLSSSDKVKGEFDYKDIITDIEFKGNRIFFVSDNVACVYDKEGNKLLLNQIDYGVKRFAVISSNTIAAITDDSINEIVLK